MKPVLVVYATRHGYTAHVAHWVAGRLRDAGFEIAIADVAKPPAELSLDNYAGAIAVASVHCGRHEAEMTRFVKMHLAELSEMASAFLSVSLSQAGAEMANATPESRARAAADAGAMIASFLAETGWHPDRVRAVAGGLSYTRYNFFLRLLMKSIAARSGGSTDTSVDHAHTDWDALDKFCAEFADEVEQHARSGTAAGHPLRS